MNTKFYSVAAAAATFLAPTLAFAWDGVDLWYDSAAGKMAGGGGIIATGAVTDYNITCAHCHIKAPNKIDATFEFTPPMAMVGNQPVYTPGQSYQINVSLVGESLGLSNCGQYMMNANNVGVAVEDASGKMAGELASDSGQTASSCKTTPPAQPIQGTTALYGDCHAAVGTGAENLSNWNFTWTAPKAGAGPLTLYYGVVDGNCDMTSYNDDVKVGTIKMGEAMASLGPNPSKSPSAYAFNAVSLLGLLPIAGLILSVSRASRRRT